VAFSAVSVKSCRTFDDLSKITTWWLSHMQI